MTVVGASASSLPGLRWPWAPLQAILLTLPGWVLLLYPLWALRVGLFLRRWRGALLVGVAAPSLILGRAALARLQPEPPPDRIRLVAFNANAFTGAPEALAAEIGGLGADAAIQVERRSDAFGGLERIADNFDAPLSKPSHGASGHCRPGLGCEGDVTEGFGVPRCEMPAVRLRVDGICVLGLHLPPPVSHCIEGQAIYLDAVTPWIQGGRIAPGADVGPCRPGDPVAAVGDLNAVPGSPVYSALRERGLRDALAGWGPLAATWPAGGGWGIAPFFQLDHVLVGDGVGARVVELTRVERSDHRAVIVEIWRD